MQKVHLRVRLKEYLASIGVSAYQLARWTEGVSAQTIYAICNGTRKPSLDVLEAVLNALWVNGFEARLDELVEIKSAVSD